MPVIPVPPTPGRMGYIGRVSIFNRVIRAMSSSLAAKQTISHPDVVDNRIDRTLYQLGPIEVDGDIAFPVVKTSESNAFLGFVWDIATVRDLNTGELLNNGQVILEYSFQQIRTFNECRVNTLELRATAGDRVEGTLNFMGTTVVDAGSPPAFTDLSPARVLTWDDVTITAGGDVTFDSCIVRGFTITINNNLSRNYTFCPGVGLFASNISTGKRFVEGSLEFQGFAATDPTGAELNRLKFTTTDTLTFDFGGFSRTAKNVIYEFQDIAINVGLITSTVRWYAHQGNGQSEFALA